MFHAQWSNAVRGFPQFRIDSNNPKFDQISQSMGTLLPISLETLLPISLDSINQNESCYKIRQLCTAPAMYIKTGSMCGGSYVLLHSFNIISAPCKNCTHAWNDGVGYHPSYNFSLHYFGYEFGSSVTVPVLHFLRFLKIEIGSPVVCR